MSKHKISKSLAAIEALQALESKANRVPSPPSGATGLFADLDAAGVSIRVDEDAADTGASVGAASAADATAALVVGRTSVGTSFLHGALHSPLIRVGAISDAQCLQWLAYEKAWLGL